MCVQKGLKAQLYSRRRTTGNESSNTTVYDTSCLSSLNCWQSSLEAVTWCNRTCYEVDQWMDRLMLWRCPLPTAVTCALCARLSSSHFGPLAINFHQRVTAQGLTRSSGRKKEEKVAGEKTCGRGQMYSRSSQTLTGAKNSAMFIASISLRNLILLPGSRLEDTPKKHLWRHLGDRCDARNTDWLSSIFLWRFSTLRFTHGSSYVWAANNRIANSHGISSNKIRKGTKVNLATVWKFHLRC